MTIGSNILAAIGNTSLVQLRRVVPADCAIVSVKLEWKNPTGSMKDRAVDRLSGRLLWTHHSTARVSTTLIVDDSSLILGGDDGRLTRLNRDDGRMISEIEPAARPYSEIARRDNVLFLPSAADRLAGIAGSLVAFDLVGKETLWNAVIPDSISAALTDMVRYDRQCDLVLIGGSDGYVFAFEPQTRVGKWTHRFDGTIKSLSVHGETMYVGTLAGRLYAFRLDK